MTNETKITVHNKLSMAKRDINVYHNSKRSAHMIGHDGSVTIPLRPAAEDDFLHISIVSGPGSLENTNVVNLPAWADFEYTGENNFILCHSHTDDRIIVKIPPGTPQWQMRVYRSGTPSSTGRSSGRITIGECKVS